MLLLIVGAFRRVTSKRDNSLRSIVLDIFLLLLGISYVVRNFLMPNWNGGRLFGLSVGMFLVFAGAELLVLFYTAKKRAAA